ncbi:hypothetical protein CgunFtcFv8_019171 [Champsocephalus gunnari]|uniref:Uncharacterized protein n=1 Tax=Champsocephalus gunnari TaxID=52237 RepID=A0AAN8DHD0_CHAGU|nr:hypothetical protein CgunFtcFv8_019171 [Champsocephalus gunnari]
MEVRVGERLLCMALLCSGFFVDSVLGKYVKGIVNTKEVSAVSFFLNVTTCVNDTATAYPHSGVSVADSAPRIVGGATTISPISCL